MKGQDGLGVGSERGDLCSVSEGHRPVPIDGKATARCRESEIDITRSCGDDGVPTVVGVLESSAPATAERQVSRGPCCVYIVQMVESEPAASIRDEDSSFVRAGRRSSRLIEDHAGGVDETRNRQLARGSIVDQRVRSAAADRDLIGARSLHGDKVRPSSRSKGSASRNGQPPERSVQSGVSGQEVDLSVRPEGRGRDRDHSRCLSRRNLGLGVQEPQGGNEILTAREGHLNGTELGPETKQPCRSRSSEGSRRSERCRSGRRR